MRPLMAAQSTEPILTWEETAALIQEAKTDPRAKRQQIAANISKMAAKADDDTLVELSVEAELFLQWLTSVRFRTPRHRHGVLSISAVAGLDRDFSPENPLIVAAARACALLALSLSLPACFSRLPSPPNVRLMLPPDSPEPLRAAPHKLPLRPRSAPVHRRTCSHAPTRRASSPTLPSCSKASCKSSATEGSRCWCASSREKRTGRLCFTASRRCRT